MRRAWWHTATAVALGILGGVVAVAGTTAVAGAGFTLSYDAVRTVGIAANMRPDWAWMFPVSVDGAMAVATVVVVVIFRLTGRHSLYAWVVLILGAVISMIANGLHALGEPGQPLELAPAIRIPVSAVPALMLTLAVHLLMTLVSVVSDIVSKGGQLEDMDRDTDNDGQGHGQPDGHGKAAKMSKVVSEALSHGYVPVDMDKDKDKDKDMDIDFVHEDMSEDMDTGVADEVSMYLSQMSKPGQPAMDNPGAPVVHGRPGEDRTRTVLAPVSPDAGRRTYGRMTAEQEKEAMSLIDLSLKAGPDEARTVGEVNAELAAKYSVSTKKIQRLRSRLKDEWGAA